MDARVINKYYKLTLKNMKKTLFFLLGLLVASVMPGSALRAQDITVNLTASTLDRAWIVTAEIYQAIPGQAYYVDLAGITPPSTANAVGISTVANHVSMTIAADHRHATATINSDDFARAFIVATDFAGKYYVIGQADRSQRDSNYFYGAALFAEAEGNTCSVNLQANIDIIGPEVVAVVDDENDYFSSLYTAIELTTGSSLTLLQDVTMDHPLLITNDITVQQSVKTINSTYTGTDSALIVIEGANVSWFGDTNVATSFTGVANDLFDVNGGLLNLRSFNTAVNGTVVSARGEASAILSKCKLNSTSGTPAINLADAANVTVGNVTILSSVFAQMDNSATGTLIIRDSTAAANTATIRADAYFKDGIYRKYNRTLTMAAANALDTLYLVRNVATPTPIASGIVIDMAGKSILSTLTVANSTGVVSLFNGDKINTLTGTGTVDIKNIDSVGSINAANLDVTIDDCRVKSILPATGANVVINGGKFDQALTNYMAPRHVWQDNTDADAAEFQYKVLDGYQVIYVNFDARNHNDTVIVNNSNDRIGAAPVRPAYVGADTVFAAYYVDNSYNTPWNFLNDALTGNTTLYAKWIYDHTAADAHYTVYHYRELLGGGYSVAMCDSVFGIATPGTSVTIDSNSYAGFAPDKNDTTVASIAEGSTINFYYTRKNYNVTFDLLGGTSMFPAVQSCAYGSAIPAHPANQVTLEGYTCIGWTPEITTVPDHDVTITAIYEQKTYDLTWTGLDAIVTYNGASQTSAVFATYTNDNNIPVLATLSYSDTNGNAVAAEDVRNVGVYIVTATAPAPYNLLNNPVQTTLTIRPKQVSVSGIIVEKVKVYNGNANVTVTNHGTPSDNYDGENLYVNTTAKYYTSNATDTSYMPGTGKTIKATMTLAGSAVDNYRLSPAEVVLATDGQIIVPMEFDNRGGETGPDGITNDKGIEAQESGFCSDGSSIINYGFADPTLTADQYKLEFSTEAQAAGFTDVDWTALTSSSSIDVVVPAGAASGDYRAYITFRRIVGGQNFDSPRLTTTFHVNLPDAYIMPIFSDVISIVDPSHTIDQNSVLWYHDGVYVGAGPYYQQPGGLTGSYFATFTINGVPNRTCEQDDFTHYPTDAATVNVTVYPNPTVDDVTVHVENASTFTHSIRVMNVLGMTLLDTTFEGDETKIDFSRYTNGSYTVSVDGVVTRVIKK